MKRLKDLREDRDLTQADVARLLGISQQYYQCYEAGKYELPLRHCITLARYYGVTVDYLVGLSPLPATDLQKSNPTLARYEKLIEKWEEASPDIQQAIKILLHDKEE